MNRLGLLHPSTLTTKNAADTLTLYWAFTKHITQNVDHAPVTWALPSSGALIGPYGILLHTPAIGQAVLSLHHSILSLPHMGGITSNGVPLSPATITATINKASINNNNTSTTSILAPRTKAIISLITSTNECAAYSIYLHSTHAFHADLLTQNELDSLRAGLHARTFSPSDRIVFVMTRELCVGSGSLSEEIWKEALLVLGRAVATAVVHFVGLQRYLATVERGFDAQIPAQGERVEGLTSWYRGG